MQGHVRLQQSKYEFLEFCNILAKYLAKKLKYLEKDLKEEGASFSVPWLGNIFVVFCDGLMLLISAMDVVCLLVCLNGE